MNLKRRTEVLERGARRVGGVSWEQYYAVYQCTDAQVISKLEAVIEGRPLPSIDPEQARSDEQLSRCWFRQQGSDFGSACRLAGEQVAAALNDLACRE